jgi:hypothetical protein
MERKGQAPFLSFFSTSFTKLPPISSHQNPSRHSQFLQIPVDSGHFLAAS